MSDLTTDDKIARLVHLVLEAVDHRLAEIRVELQTIEGRLDRLEAAPARSQGTAAPAPADDVRFERLRAEIDRVRSLVESLATRPAAAPAAEAAPPSAAFDTSLPSLPSLATVATPLLPSEPAFPIPARQAPAADPAIPATPPAVESELIDLDRLSDLLSVRLSQLNLPKPS